ncbi:uncharacterized protein [Nicotiana tomentosiformis]|uniref:uncharacterized protein n=1 Tax=Nicotiana tomentosiformis TaxID=4098 RepID=UPI00388C5138
MTSYTSEYLARIYLRDIVRSHGDIDPGAASYSAFRQKGYTDRKVHVVAFMEGERVLLRVSPMKVVVRFGKKGKFGPFEVLERVGEVAYKLALPPSLSGVHLVFHVFMLRKYHEDQTHMLYFSSIQLDENFAYEEILVVIVDK